MGALLPLLLAGIAVTRAAHPVAGNNAAAAGERSHLEAPRAAVEGPSSNDPAECAGEAESGARDHAPQSQPIVLGLRYPSSLPGPSPSQGPGAQVRPVDPATLEDLSGYQPFDFGHHFTQALSPNGRALAVMSWLSGTPWQRGGGTLRLIDLSR